MLNIAEGKILAINSPSTNQEKTELPGSDPTSLYYALLPLCESRKKSNYKIDFNSEIFNPKIWNDLVKNELLKILNSKNPDFVLISNTTPSHPYSLQMADLIKSYNKNIIIILGGPHEDETMKNGIISNGATLLEQKKGKISNSVDFVISGDGEYSLLKLIQGILNNYENPKEIFLDLLNSGFFKDVEGKGLIGTFHNGEIITVNTKGNRIDLEKIPFLYDYFNNNSFFDIFKTPNGTLKRTAHLMTTRGCIYNCIYCSESTNTFGTQNFYKNHIEFSLKQVINAIDNGSESAFFEDSVFMWGKQEHIIDFCSELIKLGHDNGKIKDFEWGCQMTIENVLRFGDNAKNILSKMKLAGCSYIFFGIESLSEEIMKNIHKNQIGNHGYIDWLSKVKDILGLVKSFGFNIGASILFGLPGETKDTINFTIDKVSDLISEGKLDLVSPNIVTYHPGTLLTKLDGVEDIIDFNSIPDLKPPYDFFEEASPGKVSIRIDEEMMFYIKAHATKKWKKLNQSKTKTDFNNKTRQFYNNNGGEKLIDEKNYPKEIVLYLSKEEELIRNVLKKGGYNAMLEIGCMQARNSFIPDSLDLYYGGIDIVERYIIEGEKLIGKNNINGEVKLLSVNDLNNVNTPIKDDKKTLAIFPFNSFGNLLEIKSALINLYNLGYDILISTYLTDDFSNKVREEYYLNCGYRGFIKNENNQYIGYRSNEGLDSKAYKEKYIKKLLNDIGYTVSGVNFGNIGIGFHCKKNTTL